MSQSPRVLIAALHWGIGHASRCIPIAKAFAELGWEVVLASDGAALDLLRISLPEMSTLEMPGLSVTYAKTNASAFAYAAMVPKLLRHINKDERWLQEAVKKQPFDLIVSDHRLGCRHKQIPSILVAHQLNIPFPKALKFLNRFHHRLVRQFDELWIPDSPPGVLSGNLSGPSLMPGRTWYMGLLSRFYPLTQDVPFNNQSCILGIASGPPPQREYFIQCLLHWASVLPQPLIIVEGLPGPLQENYIDSVQCFNHLPTHELAIRIQEASFVIARSGYSTLMDLAVFRKRVLLIPTPGQWEQEYLAQHLSTRHGFSTPKQASNEIPDFSNLSGKWPEDLMFFSSEILRQKLEKRNQENQGSYL